MQVAKEKEINMFTPETRERVRQRVIELARTDPRVTAGAVIGSMAHEAGDKWSDIDVTFGVVNSVTPEAVLDDWTQILNQELDVLDHWDLRSGSSIYRVFLLSSGLEVDVSVTPEEAFGARGPNFHMLFGTAQKLEPTQQPDASYLIGLCWHHVLHARVCVERHKLWQAEYWISELHNHLLELACLRLGENAFHGRGFDRLPSSVKDSLADALVCSVNKTELNRALAVATRCLLDELEQWNALLCTRLSPVLQEFGIV